MRHFFTYIQKYVKTQMQSYQSHHFEKTRYGKELKSYKEKHAGQICFVIGNGPSLSAKDLQALHEKGIPSFGTNRIYKIFDQTDWRPTYYISEDANVLRGVQKEASALSAGAKFIPVNLKWYEDITVAEASYFWMDYQSYCPETFNLSLDIPHSVRCRGTVTTTCIQFAIYMGFSEIYLLGVDHNFSKMVDKNGNVIEDNTVQSHFAKDYNSDIKDLGFHVDEATEAYIDIEKLSQKIKTFKVYNATRGGKLEVFERVDFDKINF